MKIIKEKNRITILDPTDFNIKQTLECGQIFRFDVNGERAVVYSQDKRAIITTEENRVIIDTPDVDYFYNFFDFDTDYSAIKEKLGQDKLLTNAITYGAGIRIIKNDLYEMIISFIISANNNIGRIKRSIEYLCAHFGKNMGEYFAFPSLDELKYVSVEDYRLAGLGYRAEQMYETVNRLTENDIENLKHMPQDEQKKFLISLKGVGEKVANCIMLFGLHITDSFPVDTWINKVYNDIMHTHETDRKKITRELTLRYGELSGYAQQYFFYYYRDNKISSS